MFPPLLPSNCVQVTGLDLHGVAALSTAFASVTGLLAIAIMMSLYAAASLISASTILPALPTRWWPTNGNTRLVWECCRKDIR
jgi:hypothetical protein